jgi:uncharacterized membrane protein
MTDVYLCRQSYELFAIYSTHFAKNPAFACHFVSLARWRRGEGLEGGGDGEAEGGGGGAGGGAE